MENKGIEGQGMNELTGIDRDLLQRDQDYFADISGLFLFAIDSNGKQITDISGRDMRETNRIAGLLNENQIEDLYNRVMQTKLEEQIVENTEFSNMKLAAVAIKSRNKPILCFIVCAVYYEPDGENAVFNIRSVVDQNIFFGGLDFLREIYNRIYDNSFILENAKLESEKLRETEKALSEAGGRIDAMTRIVGLLESDESFEDICDELAGTAGRSMKISHAYVLAPDWEGGRVEVRGKYRSESADPVIERTDRLTLLKYASIIGSKPMVVSPRTEIDYDFRLWLGSLGIISFMVLPVFSGRQARKASLYIVFADNDPVRQWEKEDIKFFGDVGRILQNIYEKRTLKESFTSSNISMKVILNNVGSCILVKDKASGEVIFINKKMEEDFSEEIKNGSLDSLIFVDDDRNDLLTEVYDEAKDRTFEMHRNVIKWVDSRYAVLYSLFDITEKKRGEAARAPFKADRAEAEPKSKEEPFIQEVFLKPEEPEEEESLKEAPLNAFSRPDIQEETIEPEENSAEEAVIEEPGQEETQKEEPVNAPSMWDTRELFPKQEEPEEEEPLKEEPVNAPSMWDTQELFPKQLEPEEEEPLKEEPLDALSRTDIQEGTIESEEEPAEEKPEEKSAEEVLREEPLHAPLKRDIEEKHTEPEGEAVKTRPQGDAMLSPALDDKIREEFILYYQPVVDIRKNNKCMGAEALLRWNSKSFGLLEPVRFLPNARETGIIVPIGRHVLRQACRAMKKWNESGHPYFKVFVNFSQEELLEEGFSENLSVTIKETGANPKNLVIEVPDSFDPVHIPKLGRILSAVKTLGCQISLDDFGTGNFSFANVKELPLNYVKIGENFAGSLSEDPFAKQFVGVAGEFFAGQKIKLCVEGIENEEQLLTVSEMKVRDVQGFFFGRPVPASEFENRYL